MSYTIELVAWGGNIDLPAQHIGGGEFRAYYCSQRLEPQEESPEMVEAVRLIDDATGEVLAHFGIEGLDFTGDAGWWVVRVNEVGLNQLEFVETCFDGEKLPRSRWRVYKSNPDSGMLELV